MFKRAVSNNKEAGFSIIEGLLGAGLLGGMALLGSQLTKQALQGQKSAEIGFAKINLNQQLLRYHSSKANCELNLKDKTFKETGETNFISSPVGDYQIYNSDGTTSKFLEISKEYGQNASASLIYNGFKIQNDPAAFTGTLPAGGKSGYIDVIFSLGKKENDTSFGGRDSAMKFKTFVTAESTVPGEYKITGCEAMSSTTNTAELMCNILGGTFSDNLPTGDGPEDRCMQLSGFALNENVSNTSLGTESLKNITSGNGNIALGINNGNNITTKSNNILIGNNISFNENQYDNVIALKGSATTDSEFFIGETPYGKTILLGANGGTPPVDLSSAGYMKIGGYIEGKTVYCGSDECTALLVLSHKLQARNITALQEMTVKGNIWAEGSTYKTSGPTTWQINSDARTKIVQGPYTKGLNEILNLNTYNYQYRPEFDPEGKSQVGIIAQDIQPHLPEAIEEGSDGYLKFNMDPVIWALVNATKEQQKTINELKFELEKLKKKKYL